MITREEIKKVEKLQKIEKEIKMLEDDYIKVKCQTIGYIVCGHFNDYLDFFNKDYNKELSRIIKHKILKLKRKRKELLKEK